MAVPENPVECPAPDRWRQNLKASLWPSFRLQRLPRVRWSCPAPHLAAESKWWGCQALTSLLNHKNLDLRTQLTDPTTMFTNLKSPICKGNQNPHKLSWPQVSPSGFFRLLGHLFLFFSTSFVSVNLLPHERFSICRTLFEDLGKPHLGSLRCLPFPFSFACFLSVLPQ